MINVLRPLSGGEGGCVLMESGNSEPFLAVAVTSMRCDTDFLPQHWDPLNPRLRGPPKKCQGFPTFTAPLRTI